MSKNSLSRFKNDDIYEKLIWEKVVLRESSLTHKISHAFSHLIFTLPCESKIFYSTEYFISYVTCSISTSSLVNFAFTSRSHVWGIFSAALAASSFWILVLLSISIGFQMSKIQDAAFIRQHNDNWFSGLIFAHAWSKAFHSTCIFIHVYTYCIFYNNGKVIQEYVYAKFLHKLYLQILFCIFVLFSNQITSFFIICFIIEYYINIEEVN